MKKHNLLFFIRRKPSVLLAFEFSNYAVFVLHKVYDVIFPVRLVARLMEYICFLNDEMKYNKSLRPMFRAWPMFRASNYSQFEILHVHRVLDQGTHGFHFCLYNSILELEVSPLRQL